MIHAGGNIYKTVFCSAISKARNILRIMERWCGKVAVVTGASSGIGANLCEKLVADGLKVVGFARRSERVEELAAKLKGKPGKLYAVKCDVGNEEDVRKGFEWVKNNVGPVNILVNNAGVLRVGTLLEGDPKDWKTVMDTNVLGLCMCTREAFKQMKECNEPGHIVHINSVAGHAPMSGGPATAMMNIYSPSKHTVTCITEVMRREIMYSKLDIKISSISPGLVATEIFENSGIDVKNVAINFAEAPILQCEDVVNAIVYVVGSPPHVQIHELIIRPKGEGLYH